MKQFACDLVIPGCDAVFYGASDRDVMLQAIEHAREAHGLGESPAQEAVHVLDNIADAA